METISTLTYWVRSVDRGCLHCGSKLFFLVYSAYMWPIVAVQSKDIDKILEVIADYYRQFNLELAELAIGNRQSKYMTLGKRYIDDLSFIKAINYGSVFDLNDVATFFNLYKDIMGNEDWTIIQFRWYASRYNLDADDNLVEKLSEKLNTKVIRYRRGEEYYSIVGFENGILADELTFEYTDVYAAKGFFQKYEQLKQKYERAREQLNPDNNHDLDMLDQMIDDGYKQMRKALSDYLNSLKLDILGFPETIKIDNDKQCRRFLLNGDPLSLQKYLKIEKMGTLDLNPLKGL